LKFHVWLMDDRDRVWPPSRLHVIHRLNLWLWFGFVEIDGFCWSLKPKSPMSIAVSTFI
jgi:hypothetical protein